MGYRIETFDAGVPVARISVEGTRDEAIATARKLQTAENVDFIRVVDVVDEKAGVEIWSERRDA